MLDFNNLRCSITETTSKLMCLVGDDRVQISGDNLEFSTYNLELKVRKKKRGGLELNSFFIFNLAL